MMTTKTAGIGEDTANPKPVRHINWCGQPMEEGDNYWGESKPQSVTESAPTGTIVNHTVELQPRPRKAKRKHGGAWTPERRAEYSAKVKAWWQAKRANSAPEAAQTTTKQGEN